ncbi:MULTISPECIES: hypothetical protein [unclassified Bradyrhizobium]|uniref:hypothetical protein n=1 Tax=unclassified Bradyrhizobium TaxID=2631580 RepID=UPI002915E7BE|nr:MULTISPECIES: hypothetical protein [unclassified Bradyrhizobium]
MFWIFALIIGALFAILAGYLLIQGTAALLFIVWVLSKPIAYLGGKLLSPVANNASGKIEGFAAWLDEKIFGISREIEIVSGPLTEEFKANSPKLARDIWHDGRRLYFEVEDRSYSVRMDLEGARKRKNELLAQCGPPVTKESGT